METLGKRKAREEETTKGTKASLAPTKEHRQDTTFHTDTNFLVSLIHTRAEQLRVPNNTVFIAERTDKIVDVFRGLIKHNFLSVPVLQKTGRKWYGFLDMADIVAYVTETFGNAKLTSTQDFWELFEKEEELRKKTVQDLMKYPLTRRNPFHPVKGGYSLFYAIEALAKEPNLHRVAVIDDERQLLGLITQGQVVKYLYEHLGKIGCEIKKPISDLKHVMKPVLSVKETDNAIDAFNLMVKESITGVAVVDGHGKLTGNISLRDLKVMAPDGGLFWRLYGTTKSFLHKLDQEGQGHRPRSVQTVSVDDTLETVLVKLAEHKIHRVFIVDEKHHPIGIITIKDILLDLISY